MPDYYSVNGQKVEGFYGVCQALQIPYESQTALSLHYALLEGDQAWISSEALRRKCFRWPSIFADLLCWMLNHDPQIYIDSTEPPGKYICRRCLRPVKWRYF